MKKNVKEKTSYGNSLRIKEVSVRKKGNNRHVLTIGRRSGTGKRITPLRIDATKGLYLRIINEFVKSF